MSGQPWFARKRYGWGWRPASRQGWALTAGYLVALGILVATLRRSQPWVYVALVIALTAIYALVGYLSSRD